MATNKKTNKRPPVAEIIGAIAAVSLLSMQLFWSKENVPEWRGITEAILLAITAAMAVWVAMKSQKTKKDKKD